MNSADQGQFSVKTMFVRCNQSDNSLAFDVLGAYLIEIGGMCLYPIVTYLASRIQMDGKMEMN